MGEAATLPEAVEDQPPQEAASARRFRVPRLRRDSKARQEPAAADAQEASPAEDPLPLAYKTFSPKLAPSLTAVGGLIAIIGGLGVWVRAVRVATEGLAAEEMTETWGYNDPEGLTIAIFGAIALVTSWVWLRRRPLLKIIPSPVLKLIPALASFACVGLVAWQLPLIDQAAQALADQAVAEASFFSFHAGLGWGAWCMTAAAVLLFLGTIVGILREIDLRRGKAA